MLCRLIIVLGALLTTAASAQTIVMSDVNFFVQTSDGKPAVCGIEYRIVFQDNAARQGNLAAVSGGSSNIKTPGKLGAFFKIHGFDMGPDGSLQRFTIHSAALYSKSQGPIKEAELQRCEEPSALCLIYGFDQLTAIELAKGKDDLHLRFNRGPGKFDVHLPVKIQDAAFSHAQEFKTYSQCSIGLIDALRAELGSTKR